MAGMRTRLILFALAIAACHGWSDDRSAATPVTRFHPAGVDPAVDPCTDFYQSACGRSIAADPIAADRSHTDWLSKPSEADRVKRVEAGLAAFALPGEHPVQLPLQRWMDLYKIPGLSIAVFDHHELVWAKAYGVKQAGRPDPVTIDTLFQAASISKPVTALAALHYVEAGAWSLDADINDKLRSWKVPDNEFTKTQKVTLRRLLSHHAGLTEHNGFPGYLVRDPLPTTPQILEGQRPANAPGVRLDAVPGTTTRYNGSGIVIVQLMMVDQLKKPFPQIMREAVLDPLGLKHSTYEQPLPFALAATAASGTLGSGETVEGRWHVYPEMGPAGLWTTASDLARIAIEVANTQAGRSGRLVSRAMAKQMLTKQSEGFGLGFELGDQDRFGHTGSNRGFKSELVAFSDARTGVVVMANSDNGSMLFNRIIASVATEYGWKAFHSPPDSALVVADMLVRLKDVTSAITWVKVRHRDGGAVRLSPNVLNSVGYRLLSERRLDDACRVFEANVELYAQESNTHDSLGECYLVAGRKPKALASYRRALELDPNNTNARNVVDALTANP
jgi:CubicO group peptidase (beta-lactamase class C family)